MEVGKFIYTQLFLTMPEPTTSFAGKTVIVTGSNVGLGKEAARWFARLNASTLILAVRDTTKGEAARQSILESTSRDPSSVEVWPLDLSSYASVISFSDRAAQLPRLDVLMENAGIATETYRIAEDNESTVTVNVVSTFLLALLLLPKLKETAQRFNTRPTLSIVSSAVHFWTEMEAYRDSPSVFDALAEKSKMGSDRYPISKLLEVFVVREWAALRPALNYPVTINYINPGLCHSELSREAGWGLWLLKALLARSTEVGSRTLVNAAEQGPETHGMYLSDCKVDAVAPFVISDKGRKLQTRVWEELKVKLDKIKPGVTGNL